jgi:RNA polymerase sigma factor (sigma-70 family)
MENVNVNNEAKEMERDTLRKEDIKTIQSRTNQLFQVMAMCEGDEDELQACRNEIIETNIRLVPHVLRKYRPYGDDEFQLGCLGLILATRSFDYTRNVPFANYACFCIERELHKSHRKYRETIEYQVGNGMKSLDDTLSFDNGDETTVGETIADEFSQEDFDKVLEDFDLTDLFDTVILPAIEAIAGKTKGQNSTVDFDMWRQLELSYILEMAEVDSQKARLTFSSMAKDLGVSVQNIRMRHQRVIEAIKQECVNRGLIE